MPAPRILWGIARPLALVALALAGCTSAEPSSDPTPAVSATGVPATATRPSSTTGTPSDPPVPATTSSEPVAGTDATPTSAPFLDGRLVHPAGLTLEYPSGWTETGPTIASEFALGADCAATKIVDFEPPPDAGDAEAGFVLQSVVQVCARPAGGSTLDQFMDDTYGGIEGFEPTEIGGEPAYRRGDPHESIAFVQRDEVRFEVLTSVAADRTLDGERADEVERIVESMGWG
jgi:hypothetical protein